MVRGLKPGSETALRGAAERAARRIGCTAEEYRRRRAAGERWCSECRRWEAAADFSPGNNRCRRSHVALVRALAPPAWGVWEAAPGARRDTLVLECRGRAEARAEAARRNGRVREGEARTRPLYYAAPIGE